MSFHSLENDHRPMGRPKNERTYLTALEYLLHPRPRPWGLLTHLAHANGLTLQALAAAVVRIKTGVTARK